MGVTGVRASTRVAASEIFRLMRRVRIPSCFLTSPLRRRFSASASSAGVVTSRGGETAAGEELAGNAAAHSVSTEDRLDERESATGSRVSTMAPAPTR